MRLAVLCVLSILGGTSMATEETVHLSNPRQNPLIGMATKRASTYRANYKRLPSYFFGLGKRWAPVTLEDKRKPPFFFGVGKRADFNFGVDKRSIYEEVPSVPYGYYQPYEQESLGSYLAGKRAQNYHFGVGKRDDLREDKLPISHQMDKSYLFGLGQRFYQPEEEQLDEDTA